MPLTRNQKIGLGVAALVGLGFAVSASADDGGSDIPPPPDPETPSPCGAGTHNVAPPGQPPICVPNDPPPPPPNPLIKNYVGSGRVNPPPWNWPHKDKFPTEKSFGAALQYLGYDPTVTNPNQQGWDVISGVFMAEVRDFQRNYNKVRLSQTVDPVGTTKQLDEDGLIGTNTINALLNAERWEDVLGLDWADLEELA